MSLVDHLCNWIRTGETVAPEYSATKVVLSACPRCKTRVLTTLDRWLRKPIMANAVPVNAMGEAVALMNRQATYRLYGSIPSTLELIFRSDWDLYSSAPGSVTGTGATILVVIQHDCRFTMLPQYLDERFLCRDGVLF